MIKGSFIISGPSGNFCVRTLIWDQKKPHASLHGIITAKVKAVIKFLVEAQEIFQIRKHGVTHQIC